MTRNHDALTRVWAAELGPRGVTVDAVAPRHGGYSDAKGSHRPDGRGGSEGNGCAHAAGAARNDVYYNVADVVASLASPDARWVTGQVLDTTGGLDP